MFQQNYFNCDTNFYHNLLKNVVSKPYGLNDFGLPKDTIDDFEVWII